MRRRARDSWSLILFVLLILAVVWAVQGSATFQTCIGQSQESGAKQPSEQSVSILAVAGAYRDCLGRFVGENDAAITAISTVIIAIFTLVLAGVTDRQARLTKEALVQDRRAFVSAIGFTQYFESDPATGNYNWRFRPTLVNSGETPTNNLTMYVQCAIRNSVLPAGFDFDANSGPPGNGLLGPKATSQGGIAPDYTQAAVTPQDLIDAGTGKKFIYLWGWIKYNDVFPKTPQHTTRYCWRVTVSGDPFRYIPNTSGQPPTPGTLLFNQIFHTEGNYAD